MKIISFVQYSNSMYVADSVDMREQITIMETAEGVVRWAVIELKRNPLHAFSWYMENGFEQCSREEYLEARYKAQAATAEFFGYQEGYEKPVSSRYNRFRDEA